MRYKDTRKPLPEVARALKVDVLLEGSVVRAGERVRIAARLIHAGTDRHLWAESYERDLRDVLALQREIARTVAQKVHITLTPQEDAGLAGARAVDPEAHLLYVKARYYWAKRTSEGFQKALEYFEQATARDAGYAAAWAGTADTYYLLGAFGYDALPPREAVPKAKAAAQKALEIDDTLAEAHAALGQVLQNYEWEFPSAEHSLLRALELNPGYAAAHHYYSNFLSAQGRLDEALAEAERALELDPLSLVINILVARPHYFARRFDEAIEASLKVLEMDPAFPLAYLQLGMARAAKGTNDEAIVDLRRFSALTSGSTLALALLGFAHARVGDRAEAVRRLEALRAAAERRYVPSYQFAAVHIGLGDHDQAFVWLDKAYEERADALVTLKVEPVFDPLRGDPRFSDLLRRVGLSDG